MRLAQKLLEEARDALSLLDESSSPRSHPVVTTALTLVAVSLVATRLHPLQAVCTLLAASILISSSHKRSMKRMLHALLYPLLVSIIASTPVALAGSTGEALSLVARVVLSTLLLLSVTMRVGWRTLAEGLATILPMIPREALVQLPGATRRFLGEAVALAAAREARSLGKASTWRLQSTVVGELLVRAIHSAWVSSFAVKARSLGNSHVGARDPVCHDKLVYCILGAVIAVSVAAYAAP